MGIKHNSKGARCFCGTAEYLAPEMISQVGYGTGVDWWALGMVLYEMMSGFLPWYKDGCKTRETRESFFHDVINEPLKFPPKVMSVHARSIISGLLQKDPSKRLGADGGKEILAHPFFRLIDWKRLYHRQILARGKPPADKGVCACVGGWVCVCVCGVCVGVCTCVIFNLFT